MSDDVIFQGLVEFEGRMRKVMTVIKMRGSEHSTATGLVVGDTLYDYRDIITGVAQWQTDD